MNNIIIIGAGGVGKEITFIIEEINQKKPTWNIVGIVDDNEEVWGTNINGYTVLGGLDNIEKYTSNNKKLYAIVAIASYKAKIKIVNKLIDRVNFATIVHPEVNINSSVKIGNGTVIYPGVIMTTNIEIGDHVIVSPKCGIGHDSVIKDYVSLLWNVNVSGNDVIEEGALIGSGATIIQGKIVGQGSIIGAGAVVVNNIEEFTTNVGVPTKVINTLKV